jgi:osmoprotectant transport system permease protein
VVASANFTEQIVLSEVMTEKLQAAGYHVDQRPNVGYMVLFLGLKHNQIDCCVNYTGDVWATVMKRKDVADRQTTFAETTRFLREQYGVECLGPLGFENAYALAMSRAHANRLGIRSIADLARHAPELTIAGDTAFFHREEWPNVRDGYGLAFKEVRPMDASLMYAAVARNAVDVACAYTTDGRIMEKDLVILSDPRQAFPPYDAILLLSSKAAADRKLTAALRPLVNTIDADRMRRANLRVDSDKWSPREASQELLESIAGKR